jgi:uncharacterized membrane protein
MHPTIGKCLLGLALTLVVLWRAWMNIRLARTIRQVWAFAAIAILLIALMFAICGCAVIHRSSATTAVTEWYRPDGTLEKRRTVRDTERGMGAEALEHDTLTNLCVVHSNQTSLGGYSCFGVGAATSDVSSNAAPVIGAAGTAVGNVVGAAAKSAVK